MPEFDGGSVEIQIKSTADKARIALDALAASVGKTKGSLQSLIPVFNSINKLAHGLKTIEKLNMGKVSIQIDAVSAALEKMSANLARTDLSGFNAQSEQAAQALNRLTNSFRQLDKLQNIDTRRVYEDLNRLGRISGGGIERLSAALSGIDTSNIATSGTAVNSLVNGLNKLQNIKLEGVGGLREQLEGLTPTLVTFIKNLQGINTDGLQRLVSALKNIPKAMEAMQGLDSTKLGHVFSILSEQIQPFIAKLKEASAELIALSTIMSKMGGPTSATSGLPKVLGGASFSGISDWIKKIATGVKNIALEAKRAKPSVDAVFTVGKLYFFFNYTKRIAQGFANMMKSAIDFIEVENLFSRSLGSARNEALRFQNIMSESFGLALPGLMRAQAVFNNILLTLGGINEKVAAGLSADMLKMTVDYAALYDQSIETAIEHFQSALTGQTKSIRTISGMDITQGTLQTYLDAAGINRTVRSLTQMEKRLLIIHALQEQMRRSGAIGAWAQEIENPANQLKVLADQLKEVGRWIGAVFINTIGEALPYINGFVMALKEIIKALALLVGYEPPETKVDEAINVGSAEDDIDGVTGAVKELKNATSGIDELNIIAPPTGAGTDGIGVDPDILGLLSEYNNLMDGVRMKAHDVRDTLLEWLGYQKQFNEETGETYWTPPEFDEAYFHGLGEKLADKLNEAMAKIPWEKIQTSAKTIATNLASLLNGFVARTNWTLVGHTIAQGLNTGLTFAHTWLTTFDFLSWGIAIGDALNGAINSFNWILLGETLAAWVMSAINTAYGVVTTFNWDAFGSLIGVSINTFFANIDWALAGETLSTGILGVLSTLRSLVGEIDWAGIGEDIRTFLANIDWESIKTELFGLVKDVLSGLGALLGPELSTLALAIAGVFASVQVVSGIMGFISLIQSIGPALSLLGPLFTGLAGPVGIVIAAIAGLVAIFIHLYNTSEDFRASMDAIWEGIKTGFANAVTATQETLQAFWSQFLEPIVTNLVSAFNRMWTKTLKPMFENISSAIGKVVELALALWSNVLMPIVAWVVDTLGPIVSGVVNTIVDVFTTAFELIGGVVNGLLEAFGGLVDFLTGIFTGDWERAWNGVKNIFIGIANAIISVFEGMVNFIIDLFNGLIRLIYGAVVGVINAILGAVEFVADIAGWDLELTIGAEPPKIPPYTVDRIPAYSRGGFPEDGLFFANHTELIGQVAGKTAVANNDMLVAALEGGVERGVLRALAQQPQQQQDDRPIIVNIDGREVVRAERNAQAEMGDNPIGGAFSNA